MASKLNTRKETISKSAAMLANLNCITLVSRYSPDLKEETHSFINNMSFNDRALLSSKTIDRNKAYQSTYRDLLACKTRIIKDILRTENLVFSNNYETVKRIEKKLSKHRLYQKHIIRIELVERNSCCHSKTAQPSTSRS
jgi:hypothetical protein